MFQLSRCGMALEAASSTALACALTIAGEAAPGELRGGGIEQPLPGRGAARLLRPPSFRHPAHEFINQLFNLTNWIFTLPAGNVKWRSRPRGSH
jgi:hypothetical protein